MPDKPKKGSMHEKERGKTNQPVSASEVTGTLGGMHFPAKKNDLEKWAVDHHARNEVVENIHNLPDREYDSIADVKRGLVDTKRK